MSADSGLISHRTVTCSAAGVNPLDMDPPHRKRLPGAIRGANVHLARRCALSEHLWGRSPVAPVHREGSCRETVDEVGTALIIADEMRCSHLQRAMDTGISTTVRAGTTVGAGVRH